jgi:hypothetical protein
MEPNLDPTESNALIRNWYTRSFRKNVYPELMSNISVLKKYPCISCTDTDLCMQWFS